MGSKSSKPSNLAATSPLALVPILCELWPGFKEYTYEIRINFIGVPADKVASIHKLLRSVFTSKGQILSDVSSNLITAAIVPVNAFTELQIAINRIPSLKVRWYDFVHLKTKSYETP